MKDIQELNIIIQTKYGPNVIRLVPDTKRMSQLSQNTINSFRDQQKFIVIDKK
jgi:hypothetical protein